MQQGKKKNKAILWDFGRVLGLFDHTRTHAKLAQAAGLTTKKVAGRLYGGPLEYYYDRGDYSTDKFQHEASSLLGRQIDPVFFAEAWGNVFDPYPPIEDVLDALKSRAEFIVLSNTNEMHWEYIRRLPVMAKYFSDPAQLNCSFMVNACKPEEKMYLSAVARAGVPISQIAYVDDVPEYIFAWRVLGGFAVQFDARTDDPKLLEAKLSDWLDQ